VGVSEGRSVFVIVKVGVIVRVGVIVAVPVGDRVEVTVRVAVAVGGGGGGSPTIVNLPELDQFSPTNI